jgi:hypothetical protein
MKRLLGLLGAGALVVAIGASAASGNHSWGGYHWATRGGPFTVSLGNNLTTSEWSGYLSTVSSAWSGHSPLATAVVPGNDAGRQKRCPATSGRVEVCNARYGNNGWLGVATIWLSGGHIAQGTVKVNDTYLGPTSTYAYNNAQERLHVICQEVGHTFGLDHQDTSGAGFGTCMDYFHNTSGDTRSTLPDQGDYDQLTCIYDATKNGSTLTFNGSSNPYQAPHSCVGTGHDDGFTTVGAAGASPAAAALPSWANPSQDVYVTHLRNGMTQISFVRWTHH